MTLAGCASRSRRSEERVNERRDRRPFGEGDQKPEKQQGERHRQKPIALSLGEKADEITEDGDFRHTPRRLAFLLPDVHETEVR